MTRVPITVAIPTYRREGVLLDTLQYLVSLARAPVEILVLDQSEAHEPATQSRLEALASTGSIRWLRLATPSIPQAMNCGLREAREEIVLFVDDDIRPEPDLVAAHHLAHSVCGEPLVAGRVIQPWDEGRDCAHGVGSAFAGVLGGWTTEFIGCNFSVRRETALALGGFDENFVRVAFRFEAEFAHRYLAAGNRIHFEPAACLHHLKVTAGGTRSFGEHLTTWKPDHAVGAYYFALRTRHGGRWLVDFARRIVLSVATKHHLRRPWWIPVTLFAELRGMAWALRLARRGPRLSHPDSARA